MNCNYSNHGKVKSNIGKLHKYLGTTFDFTEKSELKINMNDYFEKMINGFLMKICRSDTNLTLSGNNLFEKGKIWVKTKLKSSVLQ